MLPAGIVRGMEPGFNKAPFFAASRAEDVLVVVKLEAKAASRVVRGRDDSLPILGVATPSSPIGATEGLIVSWAGTSGGAGC